MHCEYCGAAIAVDATHAHYCIECGLYVCRACWRPSMGRCEQCAVGLSGERSGPSDSAWTTRRADRRLREVAREATALADTTGPRGTDEVGLELAWLGIKEGEAERIGRSALAHTPTQDVAALRPLATRLDAHAALATDAIRRAGTPPTEARPSSARRRRLELVAVAAAALLAVVVGLQLRSEAGDGRTAEMAPRDGIRSAAGEGGPGAGGFAEDASSASPNPSARPAGASPKAEPGRTVLAADFDKVRMGSGIGEGWRRTQGSAEAVAVAALPNAVDRSARLEIVDQPRVEVCAALHPALGALERLTVEVRLSTPTATGSVRVQPGSAGSELEIRFGGEAAGIRRNGAELAEADGLSPGAWYRVELAGSGREAFWTVTELDDPPGAPGARTFEIPVGLADDVPAGEVCFTLSGEPGDEANFDDLSVMGS